jgi:NAD(P)-dependent dehydrogenase (short-subunit alcohol dehydrogenase family)
MKNVLVTGATSGIGLDFVKKNLGKKYNFFLVGRNFDILKKYIKNKKVKSKMNIINFDLKKRLGLFNFKKIPKLDYIVLSAGVAKYNLIKDFNEKSFDEVVNINLIQTSKLMSYLVKNNKLNNHASIVVISSISGHKMAFNFNYAYSISKAGLKAMVESLACELGTKLIRVNSIAPGMVNTPLRKKLNQDDHFTKIDKSKYLLGKRYANTREITDVINFLLSDSSSFITGQTIIVDGGFTLTK